MLPTGAVESWRAHWTRPDDASPNFGRERALSAVRKSRIRQALALPDRDATFIQLTENRFNLFSSASLPLSKPDPAIV